MVDSDNASCIAGAWASSDTIPTAESVAIPDGVLLISPASTSDEITGLDDDGLVNRTAPPDSFQGPTLSKYLVQKALDGAQGKTINIGARNDAYGTGLADTFSKAWEAAGGTIGERVDYDIKLPNYDSEAEQIVSGNPDGIVIIDFPETYNKVGPALVRAGFDTEEDVRHRWLDLGRPRRECGRRRRQRPARHRSRGAGRRPVGGGVRQALRSGGSEERRPADVRRPELRRRDALLPVGGGSGVDRRAGHGRPGA